MHGKDALPKSKIASPPIPPFVCTERISMGPVVYFDLDSYVINHTEQKKLDDIINRLEWRKVYLVVIGYTDSAGSRKHNQELSTKRAYVVQKYLIDGGVQAEKSYAEGKAGPAPSSYSGLNNNRNNSRVAKVEIVGRGCQKKSLQ
jgi:outer membrane protein OmpA-like peptidoglycan-associated protein